MLQLQTEACRGNTTSLLGIYGAAASFDHELGKDYGLSKWYGKDDTKWFK
ncbi:MAG: hypothetical protein HRT61_12225 [Ekhidna sp.]|nr:hypothetical protein [Ekhidna sp.]